MFEAKPLPDNRESLEVEEAYINCWVKSDTEKDALNKAIAYIQHQGWAIISIEDRFIATRDQYEDEIESLECYDQALNDVICQFFILGPMKKIKHYQYNRIYCLNLF